MLHKKQRHVNFSGKGPCLLRKNWTADRLKVANTALREHINTIDVTVGTNVILSGHGSTLSKDGGIVIDESNVSDIDERKEGGFVALEKVDGKLVAQHKFERFSDFVKATVYLEGRGNWSGVRVKTISRRLRAL